MILSIQQSDCRAGSLQDYLTLLEAIGGVKVRLEPQLLKVKVTRYRLYGVEEVY